MWLKPAHELLRCRREEKDLSWPGAAGKGAFRRFRDELHEEYPDLVQAWHSFGNVRATRRAVEWLADNSLIDDEAAASFVASHPDPDLP